MLYKAYKYRYQVYSCRLNPISDPREGVSSRKEESSLNNKGNLLSPQDLSMKSAGGDQTSKATDAEKGRRRFFQTKRRTTPTDPPHRAVDPPSSRTSERLASPSSESNIGVSRARAINSRVAKITNARCPELTTQTSWGSTSRGSPPSYRRSAKLRPRRRGRDRAWSPPCPSCSCAPSRWGLRSSWTTPTTKR